MAGMPWPRRSAASWRAPLERRRPWRWRRRGPRSHGRSDWSSSSEPPVVADERVGHDHDLAGVRGVRADLLVAGLARVDDEVAAGRGRRAPKAMPGKTCRPRAPAGPARGRRCAGRRPAEVGRDGGNDHVVGTASIARPEGRRHRPAGRGGRSADGRGTSISLLPGLTGPVRRPHGTGHERTRSGYQLGAASGSPGDRTDDSRPVPPPPSRSFGRPVTEPTTQDPSRRLPAAPSVAR